MELPARACWHPPTRMTAHIARRDMSAATEEEETNGIGRETWNFFPSSQNARLLLGAQGRRRDHPISAPLNTGKDKAWSNEGGFHPILFLRGVWRRGSVSKRAG